MTYKIIFEKKACKEAEGIPTRYRTSIDKAILSLAANPRPYGSKKLTEKEGTALGWATIASFTQ